MSDFFDWLGEFGSGVGSTIGDIASTVGEYASPVAKTLSTLGQLGTTGLGVYSGIKAMEQGGKQQGQLEQSQAQAAEYNKALLEQNAANQAQREAMWGAGAPVREAGTALTAAGKEALLSGTLPPALESQVTSWLDKARTQLDDYFARAGISDSTMRQQWEAYLQQQAQTMRGQLAQQLLQGGTAAFGAGMSGSQPGGMGQPMAIPGAGAGADGTGSLIQAAQQALALLTGAQGDEKEESQQGKEQPGREGGLSDILRPSDETPGYL